MIQTVAHFVDSRTFGGTEKILLALLHGLDHRYWKSILFHNPEPAIEPLLECTRFLEIATHCLPRMDTIFDTRNMPLFVRALRSENVSVFHAHLSWPLACKYALVAANIARIPAIVATAQIYMDISQRPLLRFQPRLISTQVDRYFAVSQAIATQLREDFGIAATKIQCLNNGISVSSFDRPCDAAFREKLCGGSGRPIVMTVAALEPRKGQRYLIEAAAQLQDVMIVLVGDGPDRAALENQARAINVDDRVLFLGHRDDVADLLACCDVYVLPSFEEGLPLSILEAMAAGKPVIASAIRGNDEAVIDGESGLLVPTADSLALANAVRTILDNADLARALGKCGRERAEAYFSADTMIQRTTDAYEEILTNGPHAPLR